MVYTVKQLAKLAGVSVRTLHYYDEIGLLKPTYIKDNGYRCYEEMELLKLEQILFFKELEFPLEHIIRIITAPNFNTLEVLVDQKKFLELKKARIVSMLKTIDITINSLKGGGKIMNGTIATTQDQIEEYKKEAKKRWGDTEAYKQSVERTKHWTKEDYKRLTEDAKKFTQELADTMDKGFDSPEFQELISKHHKGIETFYDCSPDMYRALAEMYVSDPRFKAYYDKFRPGLAKFMQKAINYYCDQKQ
jgi:DNA-binding transcriptional MerR regulator